MSNDSKFQVWENILDDIIKEILVHHPKFRIKFKDQSRFQRFLNSLLKILGISGYMSYFVTTIGSTVWFPNEKWFQDHPRAAATVLLHEWVHLHDQKRFPLLFQISYLILLPAVFTFRAFWERRGYVVDLMVYKTRGFSTQAAVESMNRIFSGRTYFFMWPFRRSNQRWAERVMENPPEEFPYNRIQRYVEQIWSIR